MNIKLKITIIILLLLSIIYTFPVLKKKKLSMKYGILWTIMIVIFMFLDLFPDLITQISNFLGFEQTSNMIFLLGYFIMMCFIFILFLGLTKLSENNKKLIQELSILKYEIKEGNIK